MASQFTGGPGSWPMPPPSAASGRTASQPPTFQDGSPAPGRSRHGSGARFGVHQPGSPVRERDDRPNSRTRPVSPAQASYRARPAGQQEELDWAQALDRVANTISTTERAVRNQAHGIAALEAKVVELYSKLDVVTNVVTETTIKANLTERHFLEACVNIQDRYKTKAEAEGETRAILTKLDGLASELQGLLNAQMAHAQSVPIPRSEPDFHNMATPQPPSPAQGPTGQPPVPPGMDSHQGPGGDQWGRFQAQGTGVYSRAGPEHANATFVGFAPGAAGSASDIPGNNGD